MTKQHQQYEFGTFDERLAHTCALFEIEPFPFVYDENGEPTLCNDCLAWIKKHGINMDWLFIGSPCSLIRQYSEQKKRAAIQVDILGKMEPNVLHGFHFVLKAVVEEKLPMNEAMQTLHDVVAGTPCQAHQTHDSDSAAISESRNGRP